MVPVIGFQKSIELGRSFHRSFPVGQSKFDRLARRGSIGTGSGQSTSALPAPRRKVCSQKHRLGENWVLTPTEYLLFFGFVREYKGLRYLLEGLPQILKRFSIHLIIAGEVWGDKKLYLDLVRKLDLQEHVTFVHEYIPNEKVECYFAAADLVAIPYVSATQSGIVQLAFGFAKPVIVGRVGGLTEVVEHQKTGYLVPPRDSEAIAAAVLDFYELRREQEMVHNIEQSRSRFSWDLMADTIDQLALGLRDGIPRADAGDHRP